MIWYKHMFLRLLLVWAAILLAIAPAMAQGTMYAGESSTLSVVQENGVSYTWELYDDVASVNMAVVPGNCPASSAVFVGGISSGPSVDVTWIEPGTYFYKVTAKKNGCTMHLKVGKMIVLETLATASIIEPPPVCKGDTAVLSIILTGTGPWSIDVFDGTTTTTYNNITTSPYPLQVAPATTTQYTVTRVTDAYGTSLLHSNTVTLVVKPRPVTSPIIQYGP
jgi:hypothetical protein